MSDMMDNPFSDDDSNDPRQRLFNQEAERLLEAGETVADKAERLGLYIEGSQIVPMDTPMGPQPGLVCIFKVGDVAFTDRVQQPEQNESDDQLRVMQQQMAETDYEETKERIAKALAEGRDPFADEDSDDEEEEFDFDLDFSALAQNDPDNDE